MIIVTDASWEGQKNGPCPYFNLKESLWKAPREGESTGGMWCKQHGRPLVYSPASGALGSRFSVLYDAGFPAPPPVLALRSWFSVLGSRFSVMHAPHIPPHIAPPHTSPPRCPSTEAAPAGPWTSQSRCLSECPQDEDLVVLAAVVPSTLYSFWPRVTGEIWNLTAKDFWVRKLPLAHIKKIMKLAGDVKMINAEAPVLFAKEAQIFIRVDSWGLDPHKGEPAPDSSEAWHCHGDHKMWWVWLSHRCSERWVESSKEELRWYVTLAEPVQDCFRLA